MRPFAAFLSCWEVQSVRSGERGLLSLSNCVFTSVGGTHTWGGPVPAPEENPKPHGSGCCLEVGPQPPGCLEINPFTTAKQALVQGRRQEAGCRRVLAAEC